KWSKERFSIMTTTMWSNPASAALPRRTTSPGWGAQATAVPPRAATPASAADPCRNRRLPTAPSSTDAIARTPSSRAASRRGPGPRGTDPVGVGAGVRPGTSAEEGEPVCGGAGEDPLGVSAEDRVDDLGEHASDVVGGADVALVQV